jgi:hypothetical protein
MRSKLTIALLCFAISIPAYSQVDYDAYETESSPSYYDDEAERLRQENDERGWDAESLQQELDEQDWEEERRKERWLENEEIRRANEQREWEAQRRDQIRIEKERIQKDNELRVLEAQRLEQLRIENERIRKENERRERERDAQRLAQLRLENDARERAIAKAAALEVVMQKPKQSGVSGASTILEQLRKLGQLKDSGYLTDMEFQELKKQLLDDQT